MTVMERISEDVLSRMRLSSSAMDAYFAASPDVRRFQESAARVDKIEVGHANRQNMHVLTKLTKLTCGMCSFRFRPFSWALA